ncbi:hypothetical protein Patl1_15908 [Pistacia atlantica]|uniref:Uncharacterized protein n=1 Tax=Pistacia atlantica TaxID=434234 RepID=A0ACC1BA42_9ROSI|nr:hypothetical protein Patl1_15908 [Pistacia atlantica]
MDSHFSGASKLKGKPCHMTITKEKGESRDSMKWVEGQGEGGSGLAPTQLGSLQLDSLQGKDVSGLVKSRAEEINGMSCSSNALGKGLLKVNVNNLSEVTKANLGKVGELDHP